MQDSLCVNEFPYMPALVRFGDLLPAYVYGEDILVAFDYADGLVVSSDDWIGLFPAKWTRPEQFIAYKKAPPPLSRQRKDRSFLYTLVFHTYSIQAQLWQNDGGAYPFQFAFVSHAFNAVLGASSFFRVETIHFSLTPANFAENMNLNAHPLGFEKQSFSGHHYRSTMAAMTTFNLSESTPVNLMRRSACFQPSYAADVPSLVDLELHFGRLQLQNHLDVWNISSRADRCLTTEIACDGQRDHAELKKRPLSDPATMNGNFYPHNPADFSQSQSRRPPLKREFTDGTPKDPHSVEVHPSEGPVTNHLVLSQHDSQSMQDQYSRVVKHQQEPPNLSELASLTHRLTISEHTHQNRVRQMEKEQLRWMQRLDELRILLTRAQAENEQLRTLIQRLTEDRTLLITDFKRLELHNETILKEYQRQRVHLQDLYFTLSLHGFDYIVLPDGRKVETFHQPIPDLFALEQSRRWSLCNERPAPAMIASYVQQSNNTPIPTSSLHQAKTSIPQPCEQLMRKLADLQQQRDHIDGYIDWLKAEARKKEHIYDDPFTDDVHPSDEDFEQLDNQPIQTNPRSTANHLGRDIPANAPSPNMGIVKNNTGLQTSAQAQAQAHDQAFHSKPANLHDSVQNSSTAHHGNEDRLHSGHNPEPAPAHHGHDRRESLAVARSRFLRKDSLLSILLDSGGGVLSKPRKSIFSRQKAQHNAFISARSYSGDAGSPKTPRKTRMHIL